MSVADVFHEAVGAILEGIFGQMLSTPRKIYTWLTQPVLDPTRSGCVTMDNLMKLVVAALEWSYEAKAADVEAKWLERAAELLVLRHDTLWVIDGASPLVEADQDRDPKDRANGKEPEPETVQENEPQQTTKTGETAKEQGQTSTSPKCTFSRTVIPIDPNDLQTAVFHRWNVLTVEERVRSPQSRVSSGSHRTSHAKSRPR